MYEQLPEVRRESGKIENEEQEQPVNLKMEEPTEEDKKRNTGYDSEVGFKVV